MFVWVQRAAPPRVRCRRPLACLRTVSVLIGHSSTLNLTWSDPNHTSLRTRRSDILPRSISHGPQMASHKRKGVSHHRGGWTVRRALAASTANFQERSATRTASAGHTRDGALTAQQAALAYAGASHSSVGKSSGHPLPIQEPAMRVRQGQDAGDCFRSNLSLLDRTPGRRSRHTRPLRGRAPDRTKRVLRLGDGPCSGCRRLASERLQCRSLASPETARRSHT